MEFSHFSEVSKSLAQAVLEEVNGHVELL